MSQNEEGRAGRVAVFKKLIIAFLIAGILIPIILCILLFIKVEQLQQQINKLSSARKTEQMQVKIVSSEPETGGQNLTQQIVMDATKKPKTDVADQEASKGPVTKVYLTFDDGPSSNTDEILDILAEYDVKATFFVTGKTQDRYLPMYRRIVEEGHTLGMHSFSHRYQEIYASKEQFAEDLTTLQEFLYNTTGVWSRFYRFPGGSSNHVSDVPMEELAEYLAEENIYYLDWNVSCADATGRNLRPQQIADNVVDNVGKYHTAVVLLHDASDKTSTVEALPLIIETIQSIEEMEFAPVDDEMTMVHHLQQ